MQNAKNIFKAKRKKRLKTACSYLVSIIGQNGCNLYFVATLQNIDNPTWGIGLAGYGVIVEGIASIRQCIDLIIRTTKGSDPMRPEFGSNAYLYVDAPLNIAIPNIKKEIYSALELWEPRIKLTSIKHYLNGVSNVVFEIVYRVKDEDVQDKLLFDLQNFSTDVETVNEMVLQAFFPPNPKNYRYQVKMMINGSPVYPLPNPSGFASTTELYNWILTNWNYVGRWNLLTDRIVCYLNAKAIKSASLEISVLPLTRFSADFPLLDVGEKFDVSFVANGANAVPAMPQTFTTIGDVLQWAQDNWSNYAKWFVEFEQGGIGVFTDEFSNEFDVSSSVYTLVGISTVEDFTGLLNISTI